MLCFECVVRFVLLACAEFSICVVFVVSRRMASCGLVSRGDASCGVASRGVLLVARLLVLWFLMARLPRVRILVARLFVA